MNKNMENQSELIKPYRTKARQELRKMLPQIIKDKYSKKLEVMTVCAVFSPESYRWGHSIYTRVTGIDKKYEVN